MKLNGSEKISKKMQNNHNIVKKKKKKKQARGFKRQSFSSSLNRDTNLSNKYSMPSYTIVIIENL